MAYVSLSPPAPRMIVLFAWSTRDLLNGAVASQGKKPAVGTMYTISGVTVQNPGLGSQKICDCVWKLYQIIGISALCRTNSLPTYSYVWGVGWF